MSRLVITTAALFVWSALASAEGPAAGPSSQANDAAAGKTVGVEKALPADRNVKATAEQPTPAPDGKAPEELQEKTVPAEPKK